MLKAQPWNQLSPIFPPTSASSLLGIHFVDDRIGYVVGTNGVISKTIDGGATWISQATGFNSFYSTYFIDANTGFAVGDGGIIRRTEDGGANWLLPVIINNTASNPAPPVGTAYRTVWFYNAYIGFIVGGVSTSSGAILRTTDGGKTWDNISPTPNIGAGGKSFYGIFFTSASTGYASDFDGKIWKTVNGNATSPTWNVIYTSIGNHLNGLYFTSPTHGFAVGGQPSSNNGIVLKTTDAGLTWGTVTAIPNTRFYSDINFFGKTGFVNGGNPVSNLNGVIYKTIDEGLNWTPETINSSSGSRQFRLSLPCSHTGFSSGLNGTILKIEGINEKICCDSFNNTFLNANFTYTNSGNVYTFTKPNGIISTDILTWTFGDGQTANGMGPIVHTYPSVSNSYLATLTITRPQVGGDTCKVKLCRLINTQPCPNLVTNGDFSNGNDGSFTSLTLNQNCTDGVTGTYWVGNNFTTKCSQWTPSSDHTSGTGNFLIIDGSTSGTPPFNVWKNAAAIPVTVGTTYKFSFWVKTAFQQPAFDIEMAIEDVSGNPLKFQKLIKPTLNWTQYSLIWVATTNTVNLAVKQTNTGTDGKRDFGIDDISFTCVSCEDFMTDVMNFGIQSTFVSGNTYKYCVSPNISSSDIVQWDLDCNGTIDATTNTACQNFTLTGANSQICATVLHVIKPGDTCRVKVNTCLPNVSSKPCVCDSTFNNSVSAGFTWVRTPPFTITFTPVSLLNNCDSVRWTFGNGSATANSVGSASVSYTYPGAGTYNVCMFVTRTTPAGVVCKREYCFSIKIDGASPVAEIAMPTLNVKPNPTTQSVLITLPEGIQNIEGILKLSTVEGRTLKSMPVRSTETTMDLGILPAGLYFISFYDEKGNLLARPTKLVKQ